MPRLIPITAQQAQSYQLGQGAPQAALQQPGAQLGLTQQETATSGQSQQTGAAEQQSIQTQIPGQAAESGIKQVQQQAADYPLQLHNDLLNRMTLGDAINKYSSLMKPDDIFKQYLAHSTQPGSYGPPKESPSQLIDMGVTQDVLGKIGDNGSFQDKWNTRAFITGLRSLQNAYNQIGSLAKSTPIPSALSQAYDSQREVLGEHLSSMIPGASGSENSVDKLMSKIPDANHIQQTEPGAAAGMFNGIEKGVLGAKAYGYNELNLTAPTDPTSNNKPQSGGGLLSNLINLTVPTGGAILGGILGGAGGAAIPGADLTGVPEVAGAMAGSGAGGAGGQALADILTGKKPGRDVAVTGVLSGAGEGVGAALGGILGKGAEMLASKVPGNIFDKVVSASPNFINDIGALKTTASKYGLMDGSVGDGIKQMPKVMSDLGDQIQTRLSQVTTPVNVSDVTNNILKGFEDKTSAFSDSTEFKSAQNYIKNRIFSGTGNDNPLSGILNAQGKQTANETAETTYSNLYKLKSEVANDLKPVFKAQSNPAMTTNFTPKQEANLALWDGLKTEIDKADPAVRALNDDQHNMFDIAKGFVKQATTKKGGPGVAGDIFDALAGNFLGGPVGGVASFLGGRALANEGVRTGLSNILGSEATKQIIRGAGATAGGGLGALLGLPQ